jgi:Cu2+-exporting ATPase
VKIATADDTLSPDEALRLAAAVERDSEHMIAQGIVRSADERKLPILVARNFEAIPGKGVRASIDGREFLMGGPALLKAFRVTVPEPLRRAAVEASNRGQSAIYLATDGTARAVIAVADVIRPESSVPCKISINEASR